MFDVRRVADDEFSKYLDVDASRSRDREKERERERARRPVDENIPRFLF